MPEHYLHEGKQMDMFDQILWGPYIRILFSILNLQLQTHVFLMLSQEHLPYLIFSVGLKVVGIMLKWHFTI